MTGLDTNVLVRYIMQDDLRQSPLANRLIDSLTVESRGFIPIIAVAELGWVLSSCYDLSRDQITTVLEGILRTKELVVERAEIVWKALRLFKSGNAELADCLIACSALSSDCGRVMTFDHRTAKTASMTLIER